MKCFIWFRVSVKNNVNLRLSQHYSVTFWSQAQTQQTLSDQKDGFTVFGEVMINSQFIDPPHASYTSCLSIYEVIVIVVSFCS